MKKKAVILLSGGLDSAVTLFFALGKGYECHCLLFDYGQRHAREEATAKALAKRARSRITTVKIELPWKGSSLLDRTEPIPEGRSIAQIRKGIPSTYVPARNTIFLSMAASFAEAIGAREIFIGAHSEDSSGYPDCRKDYLEAFGKVLRLGTRSGLEDRLKLRYPL
ncbi:MAG: 7-cyano-7-deazaguanine synthase, partial [Candidatus Omnitrophica bacterium]|nr:7-cyano-7-deazaguanine synthase [Candidatus Omnitrophota bacterium]